MVVGQNLGLFCHLLGNFFYTVQRNFSKIYTVYPCYLVDFYVLIVCRKQYKSKIGAGGGGLLFSGQSLISPRNDLSASYDGAVFSVNYQQALRSLGP